MICFSRHTSSILHQIHSYCSTNLMQILPVAMLGRDSNLPYNQHTCRTSCKQASGPRPRRFYCSLACRIRTQTCLQFDRHVVLLKNRLYLCNVTVKLRQFCLYCIVGGKVSGVLSLICVWNILQALSLINSAYTCHIAGRRPLLRMRGLGRSTRAGPVLTS